MANVNISKVYLLDVPLENDYKHTLYFTSKETQHEYFRTQVKKSYTDFSYQRKDNVIRVPEHIDNLYICNYVMYQNSAYSNKWFYAFIKDMKYINDGCTEIQIETDVMQTWMFDYEVKPSFVEREHVSDDTIGLHTVPEKLETGEYIDQELEIGEEETFNSFIDETYIVLGVSEIGLDTTVPNGAKTYNGVFSGLYYLVFSSGTQVQSYINKVQESLSSDNIFTAFMIPKKLYDEALRLCENSDHFQWITVDGVTFSFFPYYNKGCSLSLPTASKTSYLDVDFVPRNKKLLTYPYKYLAISNNSGSATVYNYEDFADSECKFEVRGAIGVGCSIKLLPLDYKTGKDRWNRTYRNYAEGLDSGKLPTCGWTNDSYTNWLTGNAVNMPIGVIGGAGAIVGGAVALATGVGALPGLGMIAGGVMSVTSQLAQVYEHSLVPETAKGGVNEGELNFADRVMFTIYKKSIKEEYAKRIDNYFDMFGYARGVVKVPNKAHRSRWWFTKTIDVDINGAIPMNDLAKIKSVYNNGVTFWRNANEIGNYELTNYVAITDGAVTD